MDYAWFTITAYWICHWDRFNRGSDLSWHEPVDFDKLCCRHSLPGNKLQLENILKTVYMRGIRDHYFVESTAHNKICIWAPIL